MNWITGIQRAINYIEDHVEDDIDIAAAAREATSSPFQFQRMFSMLTGITLGDYIRMRRLSLAADELRRGNEKTIDIALRFGYDTPESFSRAFQRFHGITPTEARHGGNVRSFSRLSVKLTLYGGNLMDYRIEKRDAFSIICKRKHVNKPEGTSAEADIAPFWAECGADGTIAKLQKYANYDTLHGILGICFSDETDDSSFPYGIGAEYNGVPVTDAGFEIKEIPAHTYAVFPCRGKMPEAFRDTYMKICSEFFPQSSTYEYGSGTELEVYPSADVSDPNYSCEIWIAVNERKN